jgi:K+/H+ antiporter YhaU regulatory subunit KhtT
MNLLQYKDILLVAEGLDIVRVPVPAPLAGKTLGETTIRRDTGCTVIALRRDGQVQVNPGPAAVLEPGVEMTLIGSVESVRKFMELYARA